MLLWYLAQGSPNGRWRGSHSAIRDGGKRWKIHDGAAGLGRGHEAQLLHGLVANMRLGSRPFHREVAPQDTRREVEAEQLGGREGLSLSVSPSRALSAMAGDRCVDLHSRSPRAHRPCSGRKAHFRRQSHSGTCEFGLCPLPLHEGGARAAFEPHALTSPSAWHVNAFVRVTAPRIHQFPVQIDFAVAGVRGCISLRDPHTHGRDASRQTEAQISVFGSDRASCGDVTAGLLRVPKHP